MAATPKGTTRHPANSPPKRGVVMGIGFLLLSAALLVHSGVFSTSTGPPATGSGRSVMGMAPQLAGQREEIEGTEIVWQLPEGPAKGVLLAFHGCSHGAIDWWPQSSTCTSCIGLPEEVHITRMALSRGYAVVAISSRDRQHRRCWAVPHEPSSQTVDTLSAVVVVRELQQRPAFKGLPLYALGASSGGAFVLTLTNYLPLTAVCSQIMALPTTMYKAFLTAADVGSLEQQQQQQQQPPRRGAPVLFVHMTRDEHTTEGVKKDVELRSDMGLVSKVIEVKPQPLTAELLARTPELAGDAGQQLLQLFKQQGVTDSSGLLVEDPRHSQWHAVVRQSSVPALQYLKLTPDESGLSELMNMAYAMHEIIADTTTQMLDWFEQQSGAAGQ